MSEQQASTAPGTIAGMDLTVENATDVRDFYAKIAGWTYESWSAGDYDDYLMSASDGTLVAGVCHARGENADLPPQWMIYIRVENLKESLAAVETNGGERVTSVHGDVDSGGFCVIRDPAGAILALMQAGAGNEEM